MFNTQYLHVHKLQAHNSHDTDTGINSHRMLGIKEMLNVTLLEIISFVSMLLTVVVPFSTY